MIQLTCKRIINNLFEAKAIYENFEGKAIADTQEKATQKAVEWLKREIDLYSDNLSSFTIVEKNSLKIFKMQIKELVSLADHYYLSETEGVHNSIGWGPKGIELRGIISITTEQHQRIKQFTEAVKYNIALNNCEHFANYVMYGLNLSSQQQNWWKSLGSDIIQRLQPSNSINQNIEQEIANLLNYNLAVVKISKFQKEYLDFYKTYQQKNT